MNKTKNILLTESSFQLERFNIINEFRAYSEVIFVALSRVNFEVYLRIII